MDDTKWEVNFHEMALDFDKFFQLLIDKADYKTALKVKEQQLKCLQLASQEPGAVSGGTFDIGRMGIADLEALLEAVTQQLEKEKASNKKNRRYTKK